MKKIKKIARIIRKRRWVAGLLAAIIVGAAVGYYVLNSASFGVNQSLLAGVFPELVRLKSSSVNYEYGDVVKLEAAAVLDTDDASILESATFDYKDLQFDTDKSYPKPGVYGVKISYKIKQQSFADYVNVVVSDTTAPELVTAPNSIEITQGSSESDVTNRFNASDLSETIITFDKSNVKFDTPGSYSVTVVVTDKFGNSKKKSLTVKVVARTQSIGNGVASATYVDGILIVNKKHPLPSTYAPGENATARSEIKKLIADMRSQGLSINDSYSGYRNYQFQAQLYQTYVKKYGQEKADTFSARAGYSEHQAGLAFDLHTSNGSLIRQGTEVTWLAENAHKYGFIIRYQAGKESITGYQAEPWHLRYIGDQAEPIYKSGLSLEEYLGAAGGGY